MSEEAEEVKYATPKQLMDVGDALASGKYEQGFEMLKTLDNKYCCLGVANEVCNLGVPWDAYKHSFTRETMLVIEGRYIFLPCDIQGALARLNDKKLSFEFVSKIFYTMADRRNDNASWTEIAADLEKLTSYLTA